jgi:hypothetical protein
VVGDEWGGVEGLVGRGGEVAQGVLEDESEQAGAFEVDAVAGQAGGDAEQGALDVVAGVEAIDEERIVLDDGHDDVVAVDVAHVLVLHGGGAAADAGLVGGVHALVRLGRLAHEVFIAGWHGVPPRGCRTMLLKRLRLRGGSDG